MVMQSEMKRRPESRLKTRCERRSRSGGGPVVEQKLQSFGRGSEDLGRGMLSGAAPRWLGRGGTWFGVPLDPSPGADGREAIYWGGPHPLGAEEAARGGAEEFPLEPDACGGRLGRVEPDAAGGG